MDNNLLTIIIPTYNRCNDLETCLSYVIPQVKKYKDKVHIYISDNASTDNTPNLVQKYINDYPDIITYYRQAQNITASPNFNHAVHNVQSEYIYILSDDDIIIPGFIVLMLGYIEQYPDIEYYYLNQYIADMNMSNASIYNSNLTMNYITLYENGGELIKKYLNGPSCISANLFKRKIWINATKDMKEDCPGYVWLSILFHGVIRSKSVATINYPMFTARTPIVQRYSTNWPWYYIKGLGQLFTYLDSIYPGIYNTWIQHQQHTERRLFLMMLCSIANEKVLYRKRSKEIKPFIKSRMVRFFYDTLTTIIPGWFAIKIIKQIFRSFKILEYIKK